jgi:hypothetical protein
MCPVHEEFRKSTCPAGVYKKKKYVPSIPMHRPNNLINKNKEKYLSFKFLFHGNFYFYDMIME